MKKILLLADYYLPGYKAGGPLKSISNLFAAMQKQAEFYLLTSDRDIGDTIPYSGIATNTWITRANIHVNYLSPGYKYFFGVYRAISDPKFDTIYLNSFFSLRFSIIPLFLCRLLRIDKNIIVAPRGELATGALLLKQLKKKIYLRFSKIFGLHRNIIWHATSAQEAAAIAAFAVAGSDIRLAANISGRSSDTDIVNTAHTKSITQLVFLSRIAPIKNLLTLLIALRDVEAELALDIYGPCEDANYWRSCEAAIAQLDRNKYIRTLGPVAPDRVVQTLAQYHVFILPTRNENFGHVILEALEAGCYVMTTTGTPWAALAAAQAGFIFKYDDSKALAAAIERYAAKPDHEKQLLGHNASSYFRRYISDQQAVADMAAIFGL